MHGRRQVAALTRVLAASALAAATLASSLVAPVAADHSGSQAQATLRLACVSNPGLPIDECVDVLHSSPTGVHAWSVTDAREVSAGGGTMAGNPQFSYEETYDGATLTGVTIRGHVSASQRGGGTALADVSWRTGVAGTTAPMTASGSLRFSATGSSAIIASGGARFSIQCDDREPIELEAEGAAGSGEPPAFATTTPITGTIPAGVGECDIEVSLSAGSGTNGPAPSEQAAGADAEIELRLSSGPVASPTPDTCSIAGNVRDADGSTRAGRAMAGLKVELLASLANGGPSLAPPVATDATGDFCFRLPTGAPSGEATLRATLIDWTHTPPMLETRHGSDTAAPFVERAVHASDAGRQDLDITFEPDATRPWLSDVAAIHYESERFMRWVWDVAGVAPGLLGPVVVATGAEGGTRYNPPSATAFIDEGDTAFADRSAAESECPESCEWHELAHHVGDGGGVALIETAACDERTPHGGYLNGTTCDSLTEGFAEFLATWASLDIDENGSFGYGTAQYADRANLQDNDYAPWTTVEGQNETTLQREEYAVAQLLWDLADADPGEFGDIAVEGGPADLNVLRVDDAVALGGPQLIHLLFEARPETLVEVYDALVASPSVPAELKAANPAFSDEVPVDITPLQEVFLLHRFHPVHDGAAPKFRFGDELPYTDHVPDGGGGLLQRPTDEAVPGAAVRLVNDGGSAATYRVQIAYRSTTTEFDVLVPAGSERILHLEVPPPWSQVLADGDPLPACGGADQRPVTITVSAPGAANQSMDSCTYLHAVATTTTGYAMTYGLAGTGGGADVTTLLIIGVGAAATLILIGVLMILRRRRHHPA